MCQYKNITLLMIYGSSVKSINNKKQRHEPICHKKHNRQFCFIFFLQTME